jgi:hypothetical protein
MTFVVGLMTNGWIVACSSGQGPINNPTTAGKESASQVAAASLAGSIVTSDSIANSTGYFRSRHEITNFGHILEKILEPTAMASATCPVAPFGRTPTGTVSGATITLLYANCNPPGADNAFWSGSQRLTFDSSTGLNTYVAGNLSSGFVTRTFGGGVGSTVGTINGSSPTYRIGPNNTVVYMGSFYADVVCYSGASGCVPTSPPTAANALTGQYGVTTQFTGLTTRAVTINGLRIMGATNTSIKEASWDFTLLSGPITVTGFGASKSISGGSITLFNNKEKFTATATLTNLQWSTPSCHPTSGQITTTCKSGSTNKFETFNYNGTAQAVLVDCDNTSSNVALDHCT